MIGEKQFDCQEMFRHACSFCECADMAEEKLFHESADIGIYSIPAMVNSAFACEVFLKALLKFFDIPCKKGHRLKVLYEMLPCDLNILIYLHVMQAYDRGWRMEFLDEISNAFVRWRYLYEWDRNIHPIVKIDTTALTVFRDILREACCEIFFRTTWVLYKRDSCSIEEL